MTAIAFTKTADADYDYWQRSNPKVVKQIKLLLEDMSEHPYTGRGRPEPLKYELLGCWSRRIDDRHRIVYRVNEQENIILVLTMRHHYSQR